MTGNSDGPDPRRPPPAYPIQTPAAARTAKIVAICLLLYIGQVVGYFVYDHLL